MHRPIKSARHLSVAVAGGRISPSVSEVDIQCPAATIQKEIEFLRKKLARTNIKVSKVAESYISFYEQYVEYDPFVTCTEPPNPWISDTLDFWDQDKSGYVLFRLLYMNSARLFLLEKPLSVLALICTV